jgi:hypothetical protein
MTKEKHCKTCDERKPSTEFYKTDASMCKECKKEYSRTRYKSQAKPSTDDCKERVIKLEQKVESLEEMVRTLVQELGTLKETISHAMHKQHGDNGKKFADDDDVIYIPAKDDDTNSIPELDIKATAVEDPNHTYIVDEDTTDEYDIYKTKEDIIFLNHMMCLCGKLHVVESEMEPYDIYTYSYDKPEKRYTRLSKNKKELYKEYKMCKKTHLQRFGSEEPDEKIMDCYIWLAKQGRHEILESIRCEREA